MTEPVAARTEFAVPEGDAGQRLDRYLRRVLPEVPLSRIFRLLRKGAVRVNGRKAKGESRLEAEDKISVEVGSEELRQAPPERAAGGGFRGRVGVVFEDDDLLVLDKPAGMAVHPGTGTPPGTTLIERVWQELGASDSVFQPALAHRLDRGTSGVVVVAKTRKALLDVQRQIQAKDTPKEYLALVEGVPSKASGSIKEKLARVDSRDRGAKSIVVRADEAGQESETRWKIRRKFAGYALLDVQILSGRLHQIRAHMASIGHPIAGDDRYGTAKFQGLKRPFLHAARLGLRLYGRQVFFEAPLPKDLEAVVDKLETSA
ncbi:MAG TPA: RluA family pseudouridine synthase [Fibrobacteria bacterium]|nr:RluA family pseudouridine synthase [Fibrobacteria bacterium]